jgi:hypothetical protein
MHPAVSGAAEVIQVLRPKTEKVVVDSATPLIPYPSRTTSKIEG